MPDNETCPKCGKWTHEGERAWRERVPPIFGTDLSKPLPDLVAGFRNDITKLRGQMSDVSFRFPGWGERLASIQGLMTCALVCLYHVKEEMTEAAKRREQDQSVTAATE